MGQAILTEGLKEQEKKLIVGRKKIERWRVTSLQVERSWDIGVKS